MLERLFIGAMSGTSADGVDAALVRISSKAQAMRATLIGFESVAYDDRLRSTIGQLRTLGAITLSELGTLAREISQAHAEVIQRLLRATGTPASAVAALSAHGQTLYHLPPCTVQLFDPAYLAAALGIDVVSDFRRADCAAGGQGAPLVPFADYILFQSADENRVILNIGGIANVTVLPAGGSLTDVTGFDVGPGNCLSDWLMREQGGVDPDGLRAKRGAARDDVVRQFLADAYVTRRPPKSTDGPAMIEIFRRAARDRGMPLDDQLATAAAIVSACVLEQIPPDAALIVAGGGVHNRAIMDRLKTARHVQTTDELGIPAQAREAVAFAILGAATLDRVPANLPRVTGASRPVVLGAVTPKP